MSGRQLKEFLKAFMEQQQAFMEKLDQRHEALMEKQNQQHEAVMEKQNQQHQALMQFMQQQTEVNEKIRSDLRSDMKGMLVDFMPPQKRYLYQMLLMACYFCLGIKFYRVVCSTLFILA